MLQRVSHMDPRVRSNHPSISPVPRGIFSPSMGARPLSNSPDPSQRLSNYLQHPVENFPLQDVCHASEGIEGTLGTSGLRMNLELRGPFDGAMLAPSTPMMQRLVSPDDLQHHNYQRHHQNSQFIPGLESDGNSTSSSYASPYEDHEGVAYDNMNLMHSHHGYSQPLPSGEVPADSDWPSRDTSMLYEPRSMQMGAPPPHYGYGSGTPALPLDHVDYHNNVDAATVKQEDMSSIDGEYHEDYEDDQSSTGRSTPDSEESKTSKRRRRLTPADKCRIRCQVCDTAFSRTFNYKTHMLTHQENRPRPFSCDKDGCDKRFYRQTDLKRHDQSVHEKSKSHRCEFCDKGFPRKDSLTRHQLDGCLRRLKVRKGRGRGRKRGNTSTSNSPQSSMQALPVQPNPDPMQYMPSELALKLARGDGMPGPSPGFGCGEWHQ